MARLRAAAAWLALGLAAATVAADALLARPQQPAGPDTQPRPDARGTLEESGAAAGVYSGGAKVVVMITPTYPRQIPPQGNVLLNVRSVLCAARQRVIWVLASAVESPELAKLPECPSDQPGRFRIVVLVPPQQTSSGAPAAGGGPNNRMFLQHRGLELRNAALDFVRSDRLAAEVRAAGFDPEPNPVIFFGDDDNQYTPALFEELAKVKKIGVWPVGFPLGAGVVGQVDAHVETVSVSPEDGKFLGYYSGFCDRRFFPVDMAAFGFRLDVLGEARFDPTARAGHLETLFLEDIEYLTGPEKFEILAGHATRVNVWHLGWNSGAERWEFVSEVKQPVPVLCDVSTRRERETP